MRINNGGALLLHDVSNDCDEMDQLVSYLYFNAKMLELIKEREVALEVKVVKSEMVEKNVFILCHREYDDTYIVWTSYYTGNLSTPYRSFYNGYYDATFEQGVIEYNRRIERELRR